MEYKKIKEFFNKVITKLSYFIPSDELYIRLKWMANMDYKLNLKNPKTYNEKLNWLKLYDRRPEYTTMVDKYVVKDYVANIIGEEYVIPTLGVWDSVDEIDWESLPQQFVLKSTHDSGGVVICNDKDNLDKRAAIEKLRRSLKNDFYLLGREWPYKNVPHRIIAEKYVEPRPHTKDLPDYKFFCFNGEVKALFVATERQNPNEEVKFDFFDADFNHLPIRQGHDNAKITPHKPQNFEKMKQAAKLLSKGLPQARVDFYDLGDKVYFGELTLFHFDGMVPFEPRQWDIKFGEWIDLPISNT